MTSVRVLGGIEVGERGSDPLGSPRLRRLLAALCVRRGEVVPRDTLVDVVWADGSPGNGAAALQTLVSRLRTALRAVPGVELVTQAPGYVLRTEADVLDADRFARLAEQGAALVATDPWEGALLLDEALALWRGRAYAEFADEEFAAGEVARLTELRAVAVEDRVDAGLALGRHHEAAARLEALVAEEPLRERRREQLMLSLVRAGRRAAALDAYQAFRRTAVEELGLEPSARLRALHAQVLADDPALGWVPPSPAGKAPGSSVTGRAPDEWAGLVGREDDVREAAALLAECRLVTLTGPGGVGKTRLARAVATALGPASPGGVRVVELAAVAGPGSVALAVATALALPPHADDDVMGRIVASLSGLPTLLLLDNCEHVAAAAAAVAEAVVEGTTGSRVLVTSQVPLGAAGEHVMTVRPLSVEEDGPAVRLFTDRARAVRRDFVVGPDDHPAVVDICRRLDGLPLAIELAAARMRVMSPPELAGRLSGRFRLLHGGARPAREPHRTLQALVAWSYDLLEDQGRQVLEVLAAFAGGFTLDQAELLVERALGGAVDRGGAAREVLGLVDRSLVMCALTPHGPTRYWLLESIRAFCRERLVALDRLGTVERAHAELVAETARAGSQDLFGPGHVATAGRLQRSFDELRAAYEWGRAHDLAVAADVVGGCAVLVEHAMSAEVSRWADDLLEVPDLPVAVRRRVAAVAAAGARFSGDLTRAVGLCADARSPDVDPWTYAYATFLAYECSLFQGRWDESVALVAELGRLARARAEARSFGRMAEVCGALAEAYTGSREAALRRMRAVRADAERAGDPVMSAWAAYGCGEVLLESEPAAAVPELEQALERATAIGDAYLTGVTLVSLASVRSRHGDPAPALPLFRRALEHWQRVGNRTHQWTTLRNVAVLLSRLERGADALTVLVALEQRGAPAQAHGDEAVRLGAVRRELDERLDPGVRSEAAARGASLGDEELVVLAASLLAGPDQSRSS